MSAPWMPMRTRALDRLLRSSRDPAGVLEPRALAQARRAVRTGPPASWVTGPMAPGVTLETIAVPVRGCEQVRVVLHRPATPGPHPLLVHLHGGGFAIGSVEVFTPFCTQVAARADVLVASVDYRMAPEHVAPTAAHDAIDVTGWLVEHAGELGARADRLGVTGDSAGGNLATVVAQHLRDEGCAGLRHQALVYPSPDLTDREVEELDRHFPVLTPALMRVFRGAYLGDGQDERDPLVSPAHGRLDGLPPTLVQTAENDPLRPDGEAYAQALRAAGVEVRLTCYRGAPHGFVNLPGLTSAGYPALEELAAEVAHHLHGEDR
ncbi:alpha/beta hydrolase [Janibacter alkaliphilus]|uniref:Acetyl esterase n=1 Tax=Janibacter alkaliphilus TaxID=1069963 RepID=A0A852XBL8_9MICO|nr:alpha/beta hydrolase [Janibacter alkaliphilus]NYG38133.1 acetyl esterase [Janibacter alkaliphilus]